MDVGIYISGALFIVLGFLIKAYPNLLAGYNTMSKEQKSNVDIEGLSTFSRNCMLSIGVLLILSGLLLFVLNWMMYVSFVSLPITIGGVIYMIIGSQKYDRN